MNKNKVEKQDRFIAFAVMLSPALILIQQIMIGWFKMEEQATFYRVILTAVPLIMAALICVRRHFFRFVITYIVALLVLMVQYILFPDNTQYLEHDAFRFTLPIVILSALCLSCLTDYMYIEDELYKISWITLILAAVYVIGFLGGFIYISDTDYLMSVSYALLLPMASFYDKHKWYSILASFFLFAVALVLGSRGAIICFAFYIVVYAITNNRKAIVPLILAIIAFVSLLPAIMDSLSSIGLHSRTLDFLIEGRIADDTHRSELHEAVLLRFWGSPWLGLGMWGDRPILNNQYCHNIALEFMIDFGIILGPTLFIYLSAVVLSIFIKSNRRGKHILIDYTILIIFPLFFSGSYLINQNFGIYIGILTLMSGFKRRVRQ